MPPKPKFTREEIAAAALAIVKEKGLDALTARELGSRLGSSPRPVFTVFANMDEVRWAARELALREFEAYIGDYADYTPAFKRIGMQMVSYGIHQPELFKLLFMQEHTRGQSFETTMQELGGLMEICVRTVCRDYGLTEPQGRTLFQQMWVYAFGMGALCAMGVCDFTEEEIAEKLGQMFAGAMLLIRSGGLKGETVRPVRKDNPQA